MANEFRAGFSRICITPEEPMPLTGYANDAAQFHNRVLDDIHAACIALTDADDSTALLVTIDACWIQDTLGVPMRSAVCEATGVPEDRIYLCATHTHSAPSQFTWVAPCVDRYIQFLTGKVVQCAKEALADRKPAGMRVGSVEAKNMNSFKHYAVRDPETGEISYAGDIFGSFTGKETLWHVGQADNTLYVVRFTREDDKDILLVNWRAHPHFTCAFDSCMISASYIGPFVDDLEGRTGAHAAFFQGACGNINATNRIKAELTYTNAAEKLDRMYDYSRKLTDHAIKALAGACETAPGKIRSRQITHMGTVKHTFDHLYEQAKEVVALWHRDYDPAAANALARSYGIRSLFHALDVVYCAEQGDKNPITLNAVAIGDELAFVTFPGELFDSVSVGTEMQSPFETTLCFGYSHHHVGYMPTALTYVYTSYETDITHFIAGTAEDVMARYVRMLGELKAE